MRCFGCYKGQEESSASTPRLGGSAAQTVGTVSQTSSANSQAGDRPQASQINIINPQTGLPHTTEEMPAEGGTQQFSESREVLETHIQIRGARAPSRASPRASTQRRESPVQREKTERPSRDISAAEATSRWVAQTGNLLQAPEPGSTGFSSVWPRRVLGSSPEGKAHSPLESIREVSSQPSSVESTRSQNVSPSASGEGTISEAAAQQRSLNTSGLQNWPGVQGGRGEPPESRQEENATAREAPTGAGSATGSLPDKRVPQRLHGRSALGLDSKMSRLAPSLGSSSSTLRQSECAVVGPLTIPYGFRVRGMRVGIETAIHFKAIDSKKEAGTFEVFAKVLADRYNADVPRCHPGALGMRSTMRAKGARVGYDRWCLVKERIHTLPTLLGWRVAVASPMFNAIPTSTWRKHVEATWEFLNSHYLIQGSYECYTHIQMSLVPEWSLEELVRLAQAIIHFEPAFEALMPPIRRGNPNIRSNWLDNARLGMQAMSRTESIDLVGKSPSILQLKHAMQQSGIECYAWNFITKTTPLMVEFRKPPLSTTAEEALQWAELAMSFVHAAVRYDPKTQPLRKVPPTISGLRWFVEQFTVPGMNEPLRLDKLWKCNLPVEAVEPVPQEPPKRRPIDGPFCSDDVRRELADKDMLRIRSIMHTNNQTPYWKY